MRAIQDAFVVSHFADDVTYSIDGLLEKNRDKLHGDLLLTLRMSQNEFIQSLFADESLDENAPDSPALTNSRTSRGHTTRTSSKAFSFAS